MRIREDTVFADIEELKDAVNKDERLDCFDVWSNGRWITVQSIRVKPEFRGQGVGRKWMKKVCAAGDKLGQPVILSPEAERGHKGDLQRFYRSFGFRPNHGRGSRSDLGGAFGGEWIRVPNKF
jgi:GNAT superfamily N-acetyltransferase